MNIKFLIRNDENHDADMASYQAYLSRLKKERKGVTILERVTGTMGEIAETKDIPTSVLPKARQAVLTPANEADSLISEGFNIV